MSHADSAAGEQTPKEYVMERLDEVRQLAEEADGELAETYWAVYESLKEERDG